MPAPQQAKGTANGAAHGVPLPLSAISINGGTQARDHIHQDVVDDYAAALEAGVTFPPVVVFYDGTDHWLADGFHRYHAHAKAGRETIEADIRQGTRRDAVLHSVGANSAHGLQRSDADKRRAILTLLEDDEWTTWSDREVAKRCKVHHTTVARVREDVRAFFRGEARDEGGKYRPGRSVVFDSAKLEQIHTGYVASMSQSDRTFVHPKTGRPATMQTAAIGKGRTPKEPSRQVKVDKSDDYSQVDAANRADPDIRAVADQQDRDTEVEASEIISQAGAGDLVDQIKKLRKQLAGQDRVVARLTNENGSLKQRVEWFKKNARTWEARAREAGWKDA